MVVLGLLRVLGLHEGNKIIFGAEVLSTGRPIPEDQFVVPEGLNNSTAEEERTVVSEPVDVPSGQGDPPVLR